MLLEKKVALVTGSSRGIGRAIALRLAREGARVIVHYHRSAVAAARTAQEIAAVGVEPDPLVVDADIRSTREIRRLFERIDARYGKIDVLVNNATMGGFGPALSIRDNVWDLTMQTGARALLILARHAVPLMREGGRIVSLSSTGSHRYVPNYGALGAQKASVEALSRTLAVELGRLGIIVNVVAGGLIETDALKFLPESARLRDHARSRTALGRVGQPVDLANVVAWLCGPDAEWVCGQVIVADGGASLA